MQKTVTLAYFFWLIGGFFGLHLIYLGRFRHAACTLTTFGGFFGLSLVYDFFMMRAYVRDANFSKDYDRDLRNMVMTSTTMAPFSFLKFFAQVMVANLWGSVFTLGIPRDEVYGYQLTFLEWLIPAVSALAVHTAGNTGRDKGSIKWPLIAAYVATLIPGYTVTETILFQSCATAFVFQLVSKRWNLEKPTGFSLRKFIALLVFVSMCYGVWLSYFYFNATVTDSTTGETVKVRDALKHFFNSPMWKDFKLALGELWDVLRTSGWDDAAEFLSGKLDPTGLQHAYEVFNLTKGASGDEIKQRWRELSREWHPDRHQSSEAKELAHSKFIKIKEAYEILSRNIVRSVKSRPQ